jgi:hypothetical protein
MTLLFRRLVLIFVALSATGALVWVGMTVVAEQLIDAELLEQVLNGAVGPATDGRYRVQVDHVDVAPWKGDLTVNGIRLRPQDFGTNDPDPGLAPALRFSMDVGTVSFEGVQIGRLILDRDLEADAFTIRAPRVAVILVEREIPPVMDGAGTTPGDEARVEARGGEAAAPTPDSAGTSPTLREAVAQQLRHIHVGTVAIEDVDATIVTLRRGGAGRGEAPLRERVRGLSLTFDDFRIDPGEADSEERFLWSEDVRLEMDAMELSGGERAVVSIGAVSASTAAASIHVESFALDPTRAEAEYLAGQGPGGDRVTMATGAVSVEGLQFHRLTQDLEAVARTVRVEGLTLTVLSDKHRPGSPRTSPPTMPHDVMRELPVGITVDTVEIVDGSVTYSERGPRSQRPGSVAFADVQARLTNLTNDPARIASDGPTMLEAEARAFDAAPVSVRASIPLLAPPPTMFFFASVGRFPAGAVNAILPDLEGIRVTAGRVDSARVDIRYRPGGASGAVMVGYEDLSIRQEDRNTGNQNLGQKLTSFLANTFVIRGSNRPDDGKPPRQGRVAYEADPNAPFFKIFWEAIREGLIDVTKR